MNVTEARKQIDANLNTGSIIVAEYHQHMNRVNEINKSNEYHWTQKQRLMTIVALGVIPD